MTKLARHPRPLDLPVDEPLPRSAERTLARLHAQAWGTAMGTLFGGTLLVATMVLVARGGPTPGAHLGLLSVFFPGYSVTVGGAFIGFVYGFFLGYACGRGIVAVYNRIARYS